MSDAEIRPARTTDQAHLIEFLAASMPGGLPAWRFERLVANPWDATAPNIGYLAEVHGKIVGYFAGIYAQRPVGDRLERFCNLSVWCVKPAHRNLSVPLARALLGQKNLTFTALTPTREAQDFWHRMRLPQLDRGRWVLAPLRSPGATRPPGATADSRRVMAGLSSQQRRLVEDHAPYGCRPILLDPGGANCLVILQRREWGRFGYADVLFASDWHLAVRFSMVLAIVSLRLFRTPFVAFEARRLPASPRLAWFIPRDTFFLSSTLGAADIDSLYSEVILNAATGPGSRS